MKTEYVIKCNDEPSLPLDFHEKTEELESRYSGKIIASFVRQDGPFYVAGTRSYAAKLILRWPGGGDILYSYPSKEKNTAKIFGKRYIDYVVCEEEQIEELIGRWMEKGGKRVVVRNR